MDEKTETKSMGQVIEIDGARIRDHLGEMLRGTVDEALNAMLDAEADRLCGAGRYERSEGRRDTRAGSYERSLETRAGQVSLKIPKLRRQTFETAIIERYRRRESSVEEALIEMHLADVSVRRVEDITEALWGTRVSPSTVSNLNKQIYAKIEAWRNRPIEGEHPYVFLDGIVMTRTWAGEVRNVSLLVAIYRLHEGEAAAALLAAITSHPKVRRFTSSDHFYVDGTLVEAWASMKSVKPKAAGDDGPADPLDDAPLGGPGADGPDPAKPEREPKDRASPLSKCFFSSLLVV
jgi:Transposase, Mutator family